MARDGLTSYIATTPTLMNVTDSITATTQYGVGANAQETIDLNTLTGLRRGNVVGIDVYYATAQTTSGSGSLLITFDHADDTLGPAVGVNTGTPGTWAVRSAGNYVALTNAAASGVVRIFPGPCKQYGRLNAILHGSGASVYITSAELANL